MLRLLPTMMLAAIIGLAALAQSADVPVTNPPPAGPARPTAEVAASLEVGRKLRNAGDYEGALKAFEKALGTAQAARDAVGEAGALNNLASVYRYQAGLTAITADQKPAPDLVNKAAQLYEQALTAARAANDRADAAYADLYLGVLAAGRGDAEGAFRRYERALAQFQALNDRYYIARTYTFMGATALHKRHQPEACLPYFEQALPLFRDARYWHEAQWVLREMSLAYEQLSAPTQGK